MAIITVEKLSMSSLNKMICLSFISATVETSSKQLLQYTDPLKMFYFSQPKNLTRPPQTTAQPPLQKTRYNSKIFYEMGPIFGKKEEENMFVVNRRCLQ